MSILITGSQGFIGTYLTKYLSAQNVAFYNLKSDITLYDQVLSEIRELEFDTVIHLAGLSHVVHCENSPDKAYAVNTLGTCNILEALLKSQKKAKLVFTSTAQVYDIPNNSESNQIIDENHPTQPRNVYSRTKLAAEEIIRLYYTKYDLGSAIILRIFNHVHSSQGGDFIFPYVISQIQNAKAQNKSNFDIPIGNIDLYRDFSLIQGLINTFYEIINNKTSQKLEIYNVCSGQGRKIRNLLNLIARHFQVNINFITDPSRLRANDPSSLVGDNKKLATFLNKQSQNLSDEAFINKFFDPI